MNYRVDSILNIAREAGTILMKALNSGRSLMISKKPDGSPVTDADLESDQFLCSSLQMETGIPVLSEENPVSYEIRKGWDLFWLVDPLDGTKDFLAGNGEFAINIALIKDFRPVMGIIYVPLTGEMFYAEENRGAFLAFGYGGAPQRLPLIDRPNLVLLRSRFHDHPFVDDFAKLNGITKSEYAGAAVKFCRIALGKAAVYPRFEGSKEWDIASGDLIIRESGGQMIDLLTGENPLYNKPILKNNSFIAVSCGYDFLQFKLPVGL